MNDCTNMRALNVLEKFVADTTKELVRLGFSRHFVTRAIEPARNENS